MEIFKFLNPIDPEALRAKVRSSKPMPNFCIDNFLKEDFATQVVNAFPSFEDARKVGKMHSQVNDHGKVQITDSQQFPAPVAQLSQALADQSFLDLLSYAMDIPNLLADAKHVGGGMHQTGPRGHLDVHVDFNYIRERDLYRRLNILIYLNKGWQEDWGGNVELWDADVKTCHHSLLPVFNRCVVFETNDVSFHGVTAVTCPPNLTRKSFAAYYYTKEVPHYFHGEHTTIYRARPNEILKGAVLMPAEKAAHWIKTSLRQTKKKILG